MSTYTPNLDDIKTIATDTDNYSKLKHRYNYDGADIARGIVLGLRQFIQENVPDDKSELFKLALILQNGLDETLPD